MQFLAVLIAPLDFLVDLFKLEGIDQSAHEKVGVSRFLHPHLAIIWRTMTSMCLSLMSTPCRRYTRCTSWMR